MNRLRLAGSIPAAPDHLLLEAAVAMVTRKGRGEDPATVWDHLDH